MPSADGRFLGINVARFPVVDVCPERKQPCGVCMPGGLAHAHCLYAASRWRTTEDELQHDEDRADPDEWGGAG